MEHHDKLKASFAGQTKVKFLEHGEVKEIRGYDKSIYGQQLMFKEKKEWVNGGSHRTIDY